MAYLFPFLFCTQCREDIECRPDAFAKVTHDIQTNKKTANYDCIMMMHQNDEDEEIIVFSVTPISMSLYLASTKLDYICDGFNGCEQLPHILSLHVTWPKTVYPHAQLMKVMNHKCTQVPQVSATF